MVTAAPKGKLESGRSSRGEGTRNKSSSLMPVRGKLSHNDNQILGRVNHEYNSNPGVRFIYILLLVNLQYQPKWSRLPLRVSRRTAGAVAREPGSPHRRWPWGTTHYNNQLLRRENHGYNRNPGFRLILLVHLRYPRSGHGCP